MALIAGGIGVPHTPYFPKFAADQGPDGEINRYFGMARAALETQAPDVIILIDTDHFNTFYFDCFPTFGVGIDDTFLGPVDDVALMPPRDFISDRALAAHLFRGLVHEGFDAAHVTHYQVGHSIGVPLYFLTPGYDVPVIPIFLNGHLPPMPSSKRSLAFGEALGAAIRAWEQDIRVTVIGTGSFSLDVAGPLMDPGENFGVPDLEWAKRVTALMRSGDVGTLCDEATEPRMLAAGNVGGEVLNWIAMLGAVGPGQADWIELQEIRGHAFAAWIGDQA
ncbi:extradiol ring-cleavage dioxygenase [Pseudoruegeria sp. HB172150]|uniref:DODA-type extradiol aromatic ring-opening family dioxygenase n=1 Tax=Pseudoruegeria sp. HB172150 TaxID=2721164 RepID=UPI001555AE1F|nr:extradiol ring-cleavage dioxygenase [Pseudoruegeria sp. HB172150]